MWLQTKLPEKIFLIFNADLCTYNGNANLFGPGFSSPLQQTKMRNAISFCMDATHDVYQGVDVIMYTLLISDEEICRGWPVAYMITNDQTVAPIVQWLQFLKSSNVLVYPKQFTIDCCKAEVRAISTVFPQASIQYCVFHVLQAWGRKTDIVCKAPSGIPAENKLLRTAIRRALSKIVYENDLETFHQKINQFIVDYAAHGELINYLRRNWFREDVMKVWSRAYHGNQFSHMLTNNYIESWHN